MQTSRVRTQMSGVAGLVAVALVVWLLIAIYQKKFTDVVMVDVHASRVGLLLDPGADVRAYGVKVGEVRATRQDGDGAVLEVALDADAVDKIPEDVDAAIEATTVFGAKYVSLHVPDGSTAKPISAGTTIPAVSTTVEVNDVFAATLDLLTAVKPSEVNRALASMATALGGRGDQLGQTIADGDAYLRRLNPSLDTLATDFERSRDVLRTYSDAMPAFVDTADNLRTTSRTLSEQQAAFHTLLRSASSASERAGSFLDLTEPTLLAMLRGVKPVSALLWAYGPQLPCTVDLLIKHIETADTFFSHDLNSIQGYAGFLPGQKPYTFKDNAPKLVTGVGPKCYPLATKKDFYVSHVEFDDGTKGIYSDIQNQTTPENDDLLGALFGATGLDKILGITGETP